MTDENRVALVPAWPAANPYTYPYANPPHSAARPNTPGVLAQLWRRRGVFLGVFVGVLATVAVIVALVPRRYVATGSIIVEARDPVASEQSAALLQKLGDPADLESQLLLIHSPRLMRAVVEKPEIQQLVRAECETVHAQSWITATIEDIRGAPGCGALLAGSDALLDWVAERYGSGSVGRSRVIAVSYQSPSAATARTMANALIEAYLSNELNDKVKSRQAAADWMWREVERLGTDLKASDLAIETYRRTHGLIHGQIASISAEQLTAVAQQLAMAQAAQAEAAARLKEASGGGDAHAVLESRTVADLKQQLSLVTAQLANAQPIYGRSHPTVVALARQRDDIQSRIARETQNVVASASQTYAATNTQVAALTRQLDSLKQAEGGANGSEAALASMVREADVKRQLYVEMYGKANQLETERRVLTGDAHLVSYAELPTVPAFPKTAPFAAAGLVVAAILAAVAAFARDMMDRTIRDPEALEDFVGVPVIGQIPFVPGPPPGERSNGVPIQEPSAFQESIRALHAALSLYGHDQAARKILVTSMGAREGKTFTTLSLGEFAAATGQHVLVIEADLRCPTFAAVLGLRPHVGLVDYLTGTVPLEACVQATRTPRLHVLTAGNPHIGSTELLAGERFGDMLRLVDGYDLVLLDSPPSELLMDARIMARQVDGVLFCAAWARSDLAAVTMGVANLRRGGAVLAGCVITMVRQGEYPQYSRRPMTGRPYLMAS